jgi:anti-sigma regulatory factor (Ser/Thr protein kinase)
MHSAFTHTYKIQGGNIYNAGKASTDIKTILKQLGINTAVIRRVAIAAYEAEMNVVMYAKGAVLTLEITPTIIKIIVEDEGPGIPDINLAMREGWSTATPEMREMGFGAGMGLPNIKKNADNFRIDSVVGKGTRLLIEVNIN